MFSNRQNADTGTADGGEEYATNDVPEQGGGGFKIRMGSHIFLFFHDTPPTYTAPKRTHGNTICLIHVPTLPPMVTPNRPSVFRKGIRNRMECPRWQMPKAQIPSRIRSTRKKEFQKIDQKRYG